MNICKRCVLPSTFPGIHINDDGICNFCLSYKSENEIEEEKKEYYKKFEDLIDKVKGKADYDCALAYSGGKDSTYTLYVLKNIFKLKVLALTFDNSFLSEQAFKNIHIVTENLGLDSIILKADFKVMKRIFLSSMQDALYSLKTIERASTMCTSCIGIAKYSLLKITLEKKIPLMAWGWTPGQAPIRSSVMQINPAFYKANQEALRKPMHKIVGDDINRFFLREEQFENKDIFPYNVSPLAFMKYNEHDILKAIREIGWKSPKEVDANSTNCLLNSFANNFHVEKYGFHPYAFEISNLVRSGAMTRDEGLEKLNEPLSTDTVNYVKERLGIK